MMIIVVLLLIFYCTINLLFSLLNKYGSNRWMWPYLACWAFQRCSAGSSQWLWGRSYPNVSISVYSAGLSRCRWSTYSWEISAGMSSQELRALSILIPLWWKVWPLTRPCWEASFKEWGKRNCKKIRNNTHTYSIYVILHTILKQSIYYIYYIYYMHCSCSICLTYLVTHTYEYLHTLSLLGASLWSLVHTSASYLESCRCSNGPCTRLTGPFQSGALLWDT